MRIATRILLPPFALLLVFAAAGFGFHVYQGEMERQLERDAGLTAQAGALVGQLGADAAATQANILSYVVERRQAQLDDVIRADRSMALTLDAYALIAADDEERRLLKQFAEGRNDILLSRGGLMRAIRQSDDGALRPALVQWNLQRARVNAQLQDLEVFRLRAYDESVRAATDKAAQYTRWTGAGVGAAFLAALLYALFVLRQITRPLRALRGGIEAMQAGRLDTRIDPRLEKSRDELGGLARTFNGMAAALDAASRKLAAEIAERGRAQEALRLANDGLEERVRQRTAALAGANRALQDEVAERERAARALQRRNEDLAQFNRIASHDLQEPLRMVAGYVQLLARRYRGRLDADADEFIGYAVEGAERMQTLINDVIEYSLVDNCDRALCPVQAESALRAALERLTPAIAASGAGVSHDTLPTVRADHAQLARVFHALLDNAIAFRGLEPPRIHVSARLDGAHWVFAVTDNGIGIAPEYHERIFQIFQRLQARRHHPGNGMGLALCRRIAERFGGRIWVVSAPGLGATFYFSTPMIERNTP